MQYIVPIALTVIAIAAYILGQKLGAARATHSSGSQPLIDDLRQQVAREQLRADNEATIKTEALAKIAAADAEKNAALKQLADEQAKHTNDLAQLRKDAADLQAAADGRYAKDIAELKTAFAKMSTDVLKGMAPDVTKEVATKVEPLLEKVNTALESYRKTMQQSLQGQDAALTQVREQMSKITETTTALATSTNDFTSVLKSSQHRGKWGEQTLRRVVEASGLSPYCDFVEQSSNDGTRPDLIVTLPGDRCIIIDSKVPEFDVALANPSASNRKDLVHAHATKLRSTINTLAEKKYPDAQSKSGRTPFDKVILFLPAESLLSTALEGDNELIIDASRSNILLATPATLIGFLSAINLTWIQHKQAQESKDVIRKATDLYKSVADFVENVAASRDAINTAVKKLNTGLGSYEKFVRPKGQQLLDEHALQPTKLLPPNEALGEIKDLVRELKPKAEMD